MTPGEWLDRVTAPLAPRWTFRRQRARLAAEMLARSYDAAAMSRRTSGWRRVSSDVNAVNGGALQRLRDVARDMARNDPYCESALATIVDHTVGWGIVAKPVRVAARAQADVAARWKAWAETTACDADGRSDFAGLQKLVIRTIAESGEALVRRRWRRAADGLPIPVQLQVLEPDFLDTQKDGIGTPTGGRIIQGVEFDAIGRRTAYWLYREHPGSSRIVLSGGASQPVPASEVLHVFKSLRPGQVRGPSWFAPVLLKLKDFAEYEDAALLKQKIAACLAVLTTDLDGTAPALGATSSTEPGVDTLEPGMILNLAAGRSVTVVDPPAVTEHAEYSKTVLRAIATGLGLTYEDLCGDYSDMPFSAARMSRLRHWARIDDWRWRMLIPQFCDPVWRWAMEALAVGAGAEIPGVEWTAPPMPMIEPDKEGLAYQRNIRTGIMSWSEAVRERGYDPEAVLTEMVADNQRFDRLGIVLDSDPRKMTQAGQVQGAPSAPAPAASATGASRSGHDAGELAQAFERLEHALARRPSASETNGHDLIAAPGVGPPPATVTVIRMPKQSRTPSRRPPRGASPPVEGDHGS